MTQTPPMIVAQLSDTHLFADETGTLLVIPTSDSLQAVLDRLQALQPAPDLLLFTGDISQDNTPESYQRLRNLVAPLGIPTFWVPGNHDIPLMMQQELESDCISSQKSFQQDGWNFVLLNSAVPERVEGHLSPETLAWLEKQLQLLGDRPTLIALHHPPLPIASDWMDEINLQNADSLFAVLSRYPQVKLVLFGHIHQEFDRQHQNVCYLGAPSTCVQFKPKSAEFALDELKPGFRLLNLYADGTFTTSIERSLYSHQLDLAATGY